MVDIVPPNANPLVRLSIEKPVVRISPEEQKCVLEAMAVLLKLTEQNTRTPAGDNGIHDDFGMASNALLAQISFERYKTCMARK